MIRVAKLPLERHRYLLAKKLGRLPFDDALLALTEPQLDWVYAQLAIDRAPTETEQRYQDRIKAMFQDT